MPAGQLVQNSIHAGTKEKSRFTDNKIVPSHPETPFPLKRSIAMFHVT